MPHPAPFDDGALSQNAHMRLYYSSLKNMGFKLNLLGIASIQKKRGVTELLLSALVAHGVWCQTNGGTRTTLYVPLLGLRHRG